MKVCPRCSLAVEDIQLIAHLTGTHSLDLAAATSLSKTAKAPEVKEGKETKKVSAPLDIDSLMSQLASSFALETQDMGAKKKAKEALDAKAKKDQLQAQMKGLSQTQRDRMEKIRVTCEATLQDLVMWMDNSSWPDDLETLFHLCFGKTQLSDEKQARTYLTEIIRNMWLQSRNKYLVYSYSSTSTDNASVVHKAIDQSYINNGLWVLADEGSLGWTFVARVWALTEAIVGTGSGKLTFTNIYFNMSDEGKDRTQDAVQVFFHELSHFAGGTIDMVLSDGGKAYEWTRSQLCAKAGYRWSIFNAENVGFFCRLWLSRMKQKRL